MTNPTTRPRSEERHEPEDSSTAARLGRFVPLAGVVYVALTAAAFLLMGPYPDSDASVSKITEFYSANHGHVLKGGMLLAWASIFFVFFGAALWARTRRAALHPLIAGAALVGIAVTATGQLIYATTYFTLGDIGHKATTAPAALQAWHILGSELLLPEAGGITILLLAVALAGILARVFPRWLAWTALVLAILQLVTPVGFLASLVFLLWTLVASIVMCLRPDHAARAA
ncbi:MAG: hypothetical protein ACR2LX_07270 [Jatrophihabitans sp.]